MRYGNTGDLSDSVPGWIHPAHGPGEMAEFRQLGETEYGNKKKREVLAFLAQNPRKFVSLTARRIVCFWSGFWSLDPVYLKSEPFALGNFLFSSTVSGTALLGLWLAWRRRRQGAAPYIAVLVCFPLPYYLTHANTEYRHPMEVLLVVLSAFTVTCLIDARRNQENMDGFRG